MQANLELEYKSTIYNLLSPEEREVTNLLTIKFSFTSKKEIVHVVQSYLPTKHTQAAIVALVDKLRDKGILHNSDYGIEVDFDLKIKLFPSIVTQTKYREFINDINKHSQYYWSVPVEEAMREYLFVAFLDDYQVEKRRYEQLVTNLDNYNGYFSYMLMSPDYYPVFRYDLAISFRVLRMMQRSAIRALSFFAEIQEFFNGNKSIPWLHNQAKIQLAEIDFFRGNIMPALEQVIQFENHDALLLKSQIALFRGDYALAIKLFDQARSIDHYGYKKSKPTIAFNQEFFYWLTFTLDPSNFKLSKLETFINKSLKINTINVDYLMALLYFLKKDLVNAERIIDQFYFTSFDLNSWMSLITIWLVRGKLSKDNCIYAENLMKLMASNNQWLLVPDLIYILEESGVKVAPDVTKATAEHNDVTPLMSRIARKETWEMQLEGLLQLIPDTKSTPDKEEKSARICYHINFEREYIVPILQTYNTKTGWTAGRNISMKKLRQGDVDGLTDHDKRVASTIGAYSTYSGSETFEFRFTKAIVELCGHPLLFLFSNPSVSVELIKAEPEIYTEEVGGKIVLKTNIENTVDHVQLIKETQTRYKLISLNARQMEVIRIVHQGVSIPKKGKDQLMSIVSKLGNMVTVHSHLVENDASVKIIDADPKIRVQIVPMSDGLKAEIFVKPLGSEPPYMKPGKGGKVVYGTIEGEKCQAVRLMDQEKIHANTLSNAINRHLDADLVEDTAYFNDPYDCLELLETVAANDDIAVVEWPEGERFRIKKSVSFGQMQLSVKRAKSWFELEGELNIDENTVLAIAELLKKNHESHGRFIELGNGEFVALTEELKKQLNELETMVQMEKNKVTVNPFAAHALTDLSTKVASFKTDAGWKEFQKRIKAAETVEAEIPATLDAELRSYQEEGFRWMVRLNTWGAGACLADDMGLGKTIQAIAMMLYLAEKGPALVVCPASVASNWCNELLKFAPTLNPILLKTGNRDQIFSALSPFDVLVISYGLLQSEEENIVKIDWSMAVLDEAHAIKNTQTKSSKAAMNIQAGFKLALTGTPVQNHLGEVWNLFQFCNPGLLGTLPKFTERYVKNDVPSMRNHLKKLISPFILRRTKNNVLEELPPKTEITHGVELSPEEMAFYEALRRTAIDNIENNSGPNGQQHLQALAEITKLRLACCNTALVKGDIQLPSSKLTAFFDIIDELRANKHRALVFSQFIGHLAIVRKALDELGITYQYLDGSTSLPDREKAVKAFQTGSGELFLISLKAGGLGLNLTGADYVIHLDPWWNPAIEDQASDRAHRMGQLRPVTIYRLVAKNTIEEKIVQLHATKRNMADSLLEGSDQSARLSTTELLSILKEM